MNIIGIIVEIFLLFYCAADIFLVLRDGKYQKIWDKEKAMRLRIDPAITRAELCEQYVMFCKKNSCKVEF